RSRQPRGRAPRIPRERAPVSRKKSWSWASRAELDPALDRNELWVNPRLPPREGRWRQPLRVEVSVLESFADAL
ncbi:MAG: hypothetical protein ACRELB_22145, partial [Polyangiaceae bacterium]